MYDDQEAGKMQESLSISRILCPYLKYSLIKSSHWMAEITGTLQSIGVNGTFRTKYHGLGYRSLQKDAQDWRKCGIDALL